MVDVVPSPGVTSAGCTDLVTERSAPAITCTAAVAVLFVRSGSGVGLLTELVLPTWVVVEPGGIRPVTVTVTVPPGARVPSVQLIPPEAAVQLPAPVVALT